MKIQRHSLFFHPHVTKIIVGSVNISSITCCVFCCCKFHSQLDRSIRKNLNKIDIHIVAILSGCNGWILASLLSCIVLKTFLHTPTRTLIHSNRYVFGSSGKNLGRKHRLSTSSANRFPTKMQYHFVLFPKLNIRNAYHWLTVSF